MSRKVTGLDMAMMYAVHDALRREMVHVSRTARRLDDDPRRLLRSALGWEMFKQFLHVHHTAEDVAVWPVVHAVAAGNTDQLGLVEAMEAEHARIDPVVAAIDAAVADRDHGHQVLADLVDQLITDLGGHLVHEESEGLDLIDATMTPEQWKHFSDVHRELTGSAAPQYLPWLMEDADPELAEAILGRMPPPFVANYRAEWGPAFQALDRWGATQSSTAS